MSRVMRRFLACFLALWTASCLAQTAPTPPTQLAPGPRLIQYSGTLKDRTGQPLKGIQGVTFALYKDHQAGTALWLETQNVTADENGNYTVLLGAATPSGVPLDSLASGESRWLGVQASGLEQPRILLVSVPYALKAADADTVGGKPASAFVLAQPADGTASSTGAASSTNASGRTIFYQPATASTGGTGTPNMLTKWLDSNGTLGDSAVYESGGNVGIGTTSPGSTLTVNGTATFSGSSAQAAGDIVAFYTAQTLTVPKSNGWFYGNIFRSFYTGATANSGNFIGQESEAINQGAGTLPVAMAHQTQNQVLSSGNITNSSDYYAQAPAITSTGGITNQYGLLLDGMKIAGVTNGYGVYSTGANDINYFAGKLGIGTNNPGYALDVNGNANISGNLTLGGNISASGAVGFTGAGAFTAAPSGSGVNQGPLYVNPPSASAGQTLLGVAVNGTQEFKVDSGGNVTTAGAFVGASGMMVSNANFSLARGLDTGTASFTAGDGVMQSQTGTTAGSVDDTAGGVIDSSNLTLTDGMTANLNRPGAYLSARARWSGPNGANTYYESYILAGGLTSGASLQNGFGFKAVGPHLYGVVRSSGGESYVDLGTVFLTSFVQLLAVVQNSSSVQFYVNGVLQGTLSAALPATPAASTYEVYTTNGASPSNAVLQVAYLTVGWPMY